MLPSFKFLRSFFSYKLHSLVAGKRIQQKPIAIKLLQNIRIKNKKLAKELETACQKKGFLTFAEFLEISQFGKQGYYATHKYHGMTDSYLRWPGALLTLCKKNNLKAIIEFGCGDGLLGTHTALMAKNYAYQFSWIGIDRDSDSLAKAKKLFKKEKTEAFFRTTLTSIDNFFVTEPSLLVFSYSLDSIAPELFINSKNTKNFPNACVGISIKNGLLSEILRPYSHLKKEVITDKLYPFQRVFLALQALDMLTVLVKKLPKGSVCVILDEFSLDPVSWTHETLHMPKDLEKYDPARDISFTQLYKNAGDSLLYFPSPIKLFLNALKKSGCTSLQYDNEHLAAEKICKEKNLPEFPKEVSLCYAIVGKI